ncbi:MFS transporter [Kitasatospora sp. NPDC096077]|uniref:MFS transporter n=1 Tax=Kitasatospora sp. NPDC096077 TaxID=3155544 RepID=UPI003325F4B4
MTADAHNTTRAWAKTKTWRPRLGIADTPDFSKLLTASTVSSLGNGVYTTALPLMAAALSSKPVAVASVVMAGRLPWLLFSLLAGTLADSWDRKRVMWTTNLLRAVATSALAALIATGNGNLTVLAIMSFLIACADVFFDSGSFAVVPKMVNRDPARIRAANAQLTSGQIIGMNCIGPSAGGLLFGLARSMPFVTDALSFVTSALFLRRMDGNYRVPLALAPRGGLLAAVREGLHWVWTHPLLRWLTLISGVFSLMCMVPMGAFVLFAEQVLHLDSFGYGVLLTTGALGSLVGTLAARHVETAIGSSNALAVGLGIGGIAELLMLYANSLPLAVTAMVLGGGSSMIWNVVQISLRQSATPDHLVGRINGVHKLVTWGAMPIGAMIGGVIAEIAGLRAPFLVAGSTITLVAVAARLLLSPARIAATAADTFPDSTISASDAESESL